MHPSLSIALAILLCSARSSQGAEPELAHAAATLEKRFELVLPNASEETWRAVGWRTNLMEARELAQQQKRPLFLWIMVGNPHGCT